MNLKLKIDSYEDREVLYAVLIRNGFSLWQEVRGTASRISNDYYVCFNGGGKIEVSHEQK